MTMTCVTLKSSLAAGSVAALKPVITQACVPLSTNNPTGFPFGPPVVARP